MSRFRKKPVVIEAVQWDGTYGGYVSIVRHFAIANVSDEMLFSESGDGTDREIEINTLEGTMTAKPADWIIRGIKGEFYPCKPDIFVATYEPE